MTSPIEPKEPTPEVLELLRRMRAADPREGWPPMNDVLNVVALWFREYGLDIWDNPDEFEAKVRVIRGKEDPEPGG